MTPAVRELLDAMAREGYLADESIGTSVHLAEDLQKPLLVEGDAGVGKTDIARVLARVRGTELIRLQCYEGLDSAAALYEWNYPRQMLRVRIAEAAKQDSQEIEHSIFSREYLLERPLLRALTRKDGPAVLLIDEIDRADEAFEAFLLEVLAEFQITIPELGTIQAVHRPRVILTSNGTRELGDALRRRCLYLYVDHASLEKEIRILRLKVPGASETLALQIGRFMQALRARRMLRSPGVAESIDWARALSRLHQDHLDLENVSATLGCVVKDRRDQADLAGANLSQLVVAARGEAVAP